jgi:hypothetical protein
LIKRERIRGAVLSAIGALSLGLCAARPARAWDAAITQAGLTERALLASSFHRVLALRLGRSLGALEPLALHSQSLPLALRQSLWDRLGAFDPAGGYRPDADGVNTALAWVTAGAVLAETPAERGRHHFLEPTTGTGLDDKGGLTGMAYTLRTSIDGGGSLRGLATGSTFDLTGMASLRWLSAPENELGLPVFEASLERAVAAGEAGEREAALVQALLALGGILGALEDAGEPAHVRNDFRGSFLQRQGSSGWDRGSRFERFVVEQYGRTGVPAPTTKVQRPSLEAFFAATDGNGLADRTHRRFFSEGTIPDEIPADASTTPQDVREAAKETLRWPQPTIGRLDLRGAPGRRYMMLEGRRALAYERLPEGVRFFLDDNVFMDSATALLPEVAAYGAGLVDHLFRGSATFQFEAGSAAVKLEGLRGDKAEGTLTLYADDAQGHRRPFNSSKRTLTNGEVVPVTVPTGAKKVAVSFRGKDGAGTLVIVGEAAVRTP